MERAKPTSTECPTASRAQGVLLFLGANATGRDDKDVVNLGYALSRVGFVTMFHWSETMGMRHNIDPDEIENLVWAFQYLTSQDFVDRDRAGMGGFCVGASFALVAAADPRINDEVRFVNAFGPYFNGSDLLLQFGSRSRFYEGEREPWEPDQLTRRVLANELIDTVDDPRAKEMLQLRFLADQDVSMDGLAELDPQAREGAPVAGRRKPGADGRDLPGTAGRIPGQDDRDFSQFSRRTIECGAPDHARPQRPVDPGSRVAALGRRDGEAGQLAVYGSPDLRPRATGQRGWLVGVGQRGGQTVPAHVWPRSSGRLTVVSCKEQSP